MIVLVILCDCLGRFALVVVVLVVTVACVLVDFVLFAVYF